MTFIRSTIHVTLFFVISIVVLVYFLLHAGQVRMRGEVQVRKMYFTSVGNLKLDSPVTFAGYKIGQVVNVRHLSHDERKSLKRDVEVEVQIDKNISIHRDSQAQVLTLGFLGEKYIEITPGGIDSEELPLGETFLGDVPQDISATVEHFSKEMDEMLPTFKNTLEKVHSIVDRVDRMSREIEEGRNIQQILGSTQKILDRVDGILKENQGNVKKTIHELSLLTVDLRQELKKLSPELEKVLGRMEKSIQELDAVLDEAKRLIKNNKPAIAHTMKNLEEASIHARDFLKILKEEPWRLLSKPRPAPVVTGPKRGFAIYQKDVKE